MLCLSRQVDETVIIVVPPSHKPTTIEVSQLAIRGDKSRLGFSAPQEVVVHRKEVYDAIARENRAAAAVRPEDVKALTGGK